MGHLGAAVVVLACHNLAGAALVPRSLYVPANLVVAAVLVLLARNDGLGARELGLPRSRVARGLATGALLAALVALGVALGAVLPWTRGLFEDDRVARVGGGGELAYEVLVRIPLGTVLLEEVAFRGVLLAMLARRTSTTAAVVVSSALFGLWHIRPTLSALAINDLAGAVAARTFLVAAAVLLTGAVGALFCRMRLATGSLLAPILVHTASNSAATVAAYVVLHTA